MFMTLATIAGSCLFAAGAASAKEIKLSRTVKSGVETRLANSSRWDRDCHAIPATVTISKPPMHGTASVKPGEETLPASTPGSGPTGNCGGKKIATHMIMYRSNDGYRGDDMVVYHNDGGIDGTIMIKVE
jgi:hypothetical protein